MAADFDPACRHAETGTFAAAAVAAAVVAVAVEGIAPAVVGLADIAATGRSWRDTADTGCSCLHRASGRWSAGDVEVCRRVVYHSKGTEIARAGDRGTADIAGAAGVGTEGPAS